VLDLGPADEAAAMKVTLAENMRKLEEAQFCCCSLAKQVSEIQIALDEERQVRVAAEATRDEAEHRRDEAECQVTEMVEKLRRAQERVAAAEEMAEKAIAERDMQQAAAVRMAHSASTAMDEVAEHDKASSFLRSNWVDSSTKASCMLCDSKFGLTRRKHHCRKCGWVVCSKCSKNSMQIAGKAERACDQCFSASGKTVAPCVSSDQGDEEKAKAEVPEESPQEETATPVAPMRRRSSASLSSSGWQQVCTEVVVQGKENAKTQSFRLPQSERAKPDPRILGASLCSGSARRTANARAAAEETLKRAADRQDVLSDVVKGSEGLASAGEEFKAACKELQRRTTQG